MEVFKSSYGVFMVHVPYKGISGALTDLMGGQVQLMFASVPSVRTQSQGGKVRLVTVTGEKRSSQLPEVRTFREQGFPAMDVIEAGGRVVVPVPHSPVSSNLESAR